MGRGRLCQGWSGYAASLRRNKQVSWQVWQHIEESWAKAIKIVLISAQSVVGASGSCGMMSPVRMIKFRAKSWRTSWRQRTMLDRLVLLRNYSMPGSMLYCLLCNYSKAARHWQAIEHLWPGYAIGAQQTGFLTTCLGQGYHDESAVGRKWILRYDVTSLNDQVPGQVLKNKLETTTTQRCWIV